MVCARQFYVLLLYIMSVYSTFNCKDVINQCWWGNWFCYICQEGCILPSICLSACLSIRLSATSHKNQWLDLRENFTRYIPVDRRELIIFGSHPYPSIQEFFNASSTLRGKAFFHNLAHISGKTDRIFMKICMVNAFLDKELSITCQKNQIRLGRGLRSPSARVVFASFMMLI